MSRPFKGDFEDNASMEEFDPQVEERLLDESVYEEYHSYSLEVELHKVSEFEAHTGFPRLLIDIKLMGTQLFSI